MIVLAGAETDRAGKTMAGIARAATHTGAFIVDSGIGSGIEKFCLRKGVPLLGVAPESKISYPRMNPTSRKPNELTNGHSHFVLIGKEDRSVEYNWGEESSLKYEFAKRLTVGRKGGFGNNRAPSCKMVTVVLGDNEEAALRDIEMSLNTKTPIVILSGSNFANEALEKVGTAIDDGVPIRQDETSEAPTVG